VSHRYLHIISLDVPYPADYGGVMDIFYKICSLHNAGIRIYLHCFSNGRPPQDELDQYCEEVFYYKRKNFFQALPFNIPFMVASRNNDALLNNLQKDNHPILLEGIQCSYLLHEFNAVTCCIAMHCPIVDFIYAYTIPNTSITKSWQSWNKTFLRNGIIRMNAGF